MNNRKNIAIIILSLLTALAFLLTVGYAIEKEKKKNLEKEINRVEIQKPLLEKL